MGKQAKTVLGVAKLEAVVVAAITQASRSRLAPTLISL